MTLQASGLGVERWALSVGRFLGLPLGVGRWALGVGRLLS